LVELAFLSRRTVMACAVGLPGAMPVSVAMVGLGASLRGGADGTKPPAGQASQACTPRDG
jgi:hypothetical protein